MDMGIEHAPRPMFIHGQAYHIKIEWTRGPTLHSDLLISPPLKATAIVFFVENLRRYKIRYGLDPDISFARPLLQNSGVPAWL